MAWFGDNDERAERLAGIVFDLRRELFRRTVYRHAHERVWETNEEEARRNEANEEALMKWDLETHRLILDEVGGAGDAAD